MAIKGYSAPLLFGIIGLAALGMGLASPHLPQRPNASKPAEHVVIFTPTLSDYLTNDEGSDHILAEAGYLQKDAAASLLHLVYPNSMHTRIAATEGDTSIPGDPEPLLLMKPDAVFVWQWFAEAPKQAGLPVVELGYDQAHGVESAIAAFRLAAAVAGKSQRGEDLLARSAAASEEVRHELAGIATERKPKVLYLRMFTPQNMVAESGTDSVDRNIAIAGAQNVAEDLSFPVIGIEQLLQMNPEIIFLDSRWTDAKPSTLYDDPRFRSLRAVREHRISLTPADGSALADVVEWPLALRWMAELLYPERMPRRLRGEIKNTYREVYGYELSDGQIDKEIFLRENLASSGYDRFRK